MTKIRFHDVNEAWRLVSEDIFNNLDHDGIDGLTIEDTKMKYIFFNHYKLYEKAMRELNRRIKFYFHLLKTKGKNYIDEIGTENFEFKVVLAIHNCWNKQEKVIIRAEKFCKQFIIDASIGIYDYYNNNDDISECEKVGACICGEAKKPYMHSCLLNDNTIIQVK